MRQNQIGTQPQLARPASRVPALYRPPTGSATRPVAVEQRRGDVALAVAHFPIPSASFSFDAAGYGGHPYLVSCPDDAGGVHRFAAVLDVPEPATLAALAAAMGGPVRSSGPAWGADTKFRSTRPSAPGGRSHAVFLVPVS